MSIKFQRTLPILANLPYESKREFMRVALLLVPALGAFPTFAQTQAAKLMDVRLAVPGPGSAVSLPLELAVKLGLDRVEGVNMRLKFVGGGSIAINDLQAADVEYGVFGLPAAMAAHLKGARLVALAAVEDRAQWVMMVRSDLRTRVRKVPDLRGKRVGVHSNSLTNKTTGDLITQLVLSSNGIAQGESPRESWRLVGLSQASNVET